MSFTTIGKLSKLYFIKVQAFFIIASSIFFAFFLRLELAPLLTDKLPLAFFIIDSLMITHLYGLVAGYSTLIVGAVISYYFFVPPYDSWGIPDAYHLIYFSTKFVIGSLLVLLVIWVNDQMKEIFSHH